MSYLFVIQVGENLLKCTIEDEKDLVLNGVLFPPYILIPININEEKNVKYFISTIFQSITILNSFTIIHFVYLHGKKYWAKNTKTGNVVTKFWYSLKNLNPSVTLDICELFVCYHIKFWV